MPDKTPVELKVITTCKEVENIRDAWSSMQWFPEADIDFVSLIIAVRPEVIRPYVIAVCKDGKPLSLLVGRVEQAHLDIRVGYKTLWRPTVRRLAIFCGGFMGQTGPEMSELIVRRLLQSLREEKADLLAWNGVDWNTDLRMLLGHIPGFLCRDYLMRPLKHWRMSLPGSLEELLEKRMNKKHRYWAKRTMRMLENDFPGAVRYVSYSALAEVERLFEDVLRVARKTYQWGLGVGFQGSEENKKRLELEARNGWFRGYVLYLNEEPLAFWICTIYGNTIYLDYTGYDPAYAKYEVGTALLLRVIENMCGSKVKQLDFGPGAAFYKERLADSTFEETTVLVFSSSVRGVLLNVLRTITQGAVELMRNLVSRWGLEQKVKRLWRSYATPARET